MIDPGIRPAMTDGIRSSQPPHQLHPVMKTTLLFLALFSFTALAPAADKKDEKKPDRKSRNEKKNDKKDDKKEERSQFEVTVTGASDAAAEDDVKTFISSMEDVRVEKSEKTDKGIELVISVPPGAKAKLSRGDIARALKDNKDLKVAEFKAVRPGREKDPKKDDKKDEKKDEKKTDDNKTTDKKADGVKPADAKPDAKPAAKTN